MNTMHGFRWNLRRGLAATWGRGVLNLSLSRALPSALLALSCLVWTAAVRADSQDESNYSKGVELGKAGKYKDALPFLTKEIESNPASAKAYGARAYVYWALGEQQKAMADFNESLRLDPKNPQTYMNRGRSWFARGDYDKAIADYNEAIRLDPTFGHAYTNRAGAWNEKGDFQKAIADGNEALRIDAKDELALLNRAIARNGTGQYDKAIADLNEVIKLNPTISEAYNGLAWLQATCPDPRFRDGQKAYENALAAYKLSKGAVASHMDSLAAAYAENGDFEHASEWQTKAIEAAKTDDEKKEGRQRLELYKLGKPYREPAAAR
jgi:tetratricopeptide (TPR) repeat protein